MYQTVCFFWGGQGHCFLDLPLFRPRRPPKKRGFSTLPAEVHPGRKNIFFQKLYKFTLMTFLAMFLLDTPPWRFTMNWKCPSHRWLQLKKDVQVKLDHFLKGWGFKKKNLLWRIIPASKWLGSPPFISHEKATWKGNNPSWGDLLIMVIKHLQVLGWSSK